MPKVLTFVVCDKVVREEGANNISIISFLEEVHIVIPKAFGPPPPKTFATTTWSGFALLEREPGDEQKTFEIKLRLVSQTDELLFETGSKSIRFPTPRVRHIWNNSGFPIWAPGRCEARLNIRESSEPGFREIASFPVQVMHEPESWLPTDA